MLYNNESNLLFIDAKDRNRIFNYDLEKGQIAEEYNTKGKIGEEGVLAMICDSTNVFSAGRSGSELDVRKNMLNVMSLTLLFFINKICMIRGIPCKYNNA